MPLTGLHILVTRPLLQSNLLAEIIKQHQGIPLIFPTLEILPNNDKSIIDKLVKNLRFTDIIIFISENSVKHSLPYIKDQLSDKILIAAIGNNTATALAKNNLQVDIIPHEFSSEGLLAHSLLNDIANKNISIIKGEGGRNLLEQELYQRTANIDTFAVYQRQCPQADITPFLQEKLDVIISASNESLTNLLQLTPKHLKERLKTIPLLVISHRMQQFAKKLGFKHILVTQTVSNQAIVERLEVFNII